MLVHPDVLFTNALAHHRQALKHSRRTENSKPTEVANSRVSSMRPFAKRLRAAQS